MLGVRSGLLTASAAALLLGATGYALQGSPGLRGAPRGRRGRDIFPLTDARHAFFGYFTPAESWLRMSEALGARRQERGCRGHPAKCGKALSRRPAAVDRPRQRAGRSCPRPDAAGRARLPACRRMAPGPSGGAFLLRTCAGPLGRPRGRRRDVAARYSRKRRRTPAGGRWSSKASRRSAGSREPRQRR